MKPKQNSWNPERWRTRCAWCAKKIPANREVFGISIRLRSEAFREVTPGQIEPLLLPQSLKTIPLIIVTEDSPAKQEGKDAMFQLCSEPCARALQAALQVELAPD